MKFSSCLNDPCTDENFVQRNSKSEYSAKNTPENATNKYAVVNFFGILKSVKYGSPVNKLRYFHISLLYMRLKILLFITANFQAGFYRRAGLDCGSCPTFRRFFPSPCFNYDKLYDIRYILLSKEKLRYRRRVY